MRLMFPANPVATIKVTCTMMNPKKLSMVRKWIDLADCLPPKIRAYQGKRFTIARDMAIPVRIAKGPKTKTTVK